MSPEATTTRPRATRYRRLDHGRYWQELDERRDRVATRLGLGIIYDHVYDQEPSGTVALMEEDRRLVRRGLRLTQLMEAAWQQYKRELARGVVCDDRR